MIWKRVTNYMIIADGSVRREIRKAMKEYSLIETEKRAKRIYEKLLDQNADCSCNDYHYSQQALIFLQHKTET